MTTTQTIPTAKTTLNPVEFTDRKRDLDIALIIAEGQFRALRSPETRRSLKLANIALAEFKSTHRRGK